MNCLLDNPLRRESRAKFAELAIAAAALLIFSLICLEELKNVGKPIDLREKWRFASVPLADWALLIAVSLIAVAPKEIFRCAFRPFPLVIICIFVWGAFVGLIRNPSFVFFGADLRDVSWVAGGAIAGFALRQSRYWPHALFAAIAVGTAYLYIAGVGDERVSVAELSLLNVRIYSKSMFQYSYMLQFCTAIVMTYAISTKNWLLLLCTFAATCFHFYIGVILGATKSIAVYLIVMLLSAVVCGYRLREGRRAARRFLIIGLAFFAATAIGLIGLDPRFFAGREIVVLSRLQDVSDLALSIDARIEEAVSMLGWLRPIDYFIGKGFGSTFPSIIAGETNAPHIGALAPLLKFGIFGFLIISGTLYLRTTLEFLLRPIFSPDGIDNVRLRMVILVLPVFATWATTLMISGGTEYFSTFGVGVAVGFCWAQDTLYRNV